MTAILFLQNYAPSLWKQIHKYNSILLALKQSLGIFCLVLFFRLFSLILAEMPYSDTYI